MALRRSARNLARSQPSSKDTVIGSRPKRGSHGFHKFKNGILNLTPVSDEETTLCDTNARESDLLGLPAEIRTMIWKYALGGQTVSLATKYAIPTEAYKVTDRFPLLRVCRQIYSEAALLPYTHSTFCFWEAAHYPEYAKSSLINHAQHIEVRIYAVYFADDEPVKNYFPRYLTHNLRTLELTLWLGKKTRMAKQQQAREHYKNFITHEGLTVRFLDRQPEWRERLAHRTPEKCTAYERWRRLQNMLM